MISFITLHAYVFNKSLFLKEIKIWLNVFILSGRASAKAKPT